MITRKTGYEIDGKFFVSIEEAKSAALQALFKETLPDAPIEEYTVDDCVKAVMSRQAEVIDILTTTATSKPAARRINGGTKARKPKSVAAQFNEIAKESADAMKAKIAEGKAGQ